MEQRLQKALAAAGIASRRSCEALIAAGRVSVNGNRVTELGAKADPDVDDIRVDNKRISTGVALHYIVLNKPTGYVTTVKDPHAERTVMDLVRGVPGRLYPVGRLDVDSAGLLLLTNDGHFTQQLTHPSHQVPKTYRAVVRGEVPAWAAADLRKGMLLDDGMTAPAEAEWVDYDEANNASIIDVTIHEGRNRQVRRMFEALGYPVLALTRIRIGPILLKGLPPGGWRNLRAAEVKALLNDADSRPPSLPQSPVEAAPPESEEPVAEPPLRRTPVRRDSRRSVNERQRPELTRDRPAQREARKDPAPGAPVPRAAESDLRATARALSERLRDRGRNTDDPPVPGPSKAPRSRGRQPRGK